MSIRSAQSNHYCIASNDDEQEEGEIFRISRQNPAHFKQLPVGKDAEIKNTQCSFFLWFKTKYVFCVCESVEFN